MKLPTFCIFVSLLLWCRGTYAASPTGGYADVKPNLVAYLRLTQIGNALTGFMQLVYADGSNQGYRIKAAAASGMVTAGNVYLVGSSVADLLGQGAEGRIVGKQIVFTIPLTDGTIRTEIFTPMTPDHWNSVLSSFKNRLASRAAALTARRDFQTHIESVYLDYLSSLGAEKDAASKVTDCQQSLAKTNTTSALPGQVQSDIAPSDAQDKIADDQEVLKGELDRLHVNAVEVAKDAMELNATTTGQTKLKAVAVHPVGLPTMPLSRNARAIYPLYRGAVAGIASRTSPEQLDAMTSNILKYSEQSRVDPRLILTVLLADNDPAGTVQACVVVPYQSEAALHSLTQNLRTLLDRSKNKLRASMTQYHRQREAHSLATDKETPEAYAAHVAGLYEAMCGDISRR